MTITPAPSTPLVRLLCIRHGESTDNLAKVCSSSAPGAALTPAGRAQARSAFEAVRSEPVSMVYASTARRAIETAAVIADGFGVPARTDPGLLEYGVGRYEGSTEESARRASFTMLRTWLVDGDLEARLPGGESGRQVLNRFIDSMNRIAATHAGETVVVVGHVGTFTLGLLTMCADLPLSRVWGWPLPHAASVRIHRDNGTWQCPNWPGVPLAT
jgi:alpha-ribazole phosphatase/probable phosphoglycerate mutase